MLDLAWAAGFIDGEGSIMITRRNKKGEVSYELSLQVRQVDRKPLDKLVDLFGGSVYFSSQPIFYCQWWGKKAASILNAVSPYLVVKKAEADLALEFQGRRRQGVKSDVDLNVTQYEQMKSLKRRSLNA